MEGQVKLSWIDFFMKWSDKLVTYKENRQDLLEILEGIYTKLDLRFPLTEEGQRLKDVCPFTVLACINRGISDANRIRLASEVIQAFDLETEVPKEFYGVTTMNPMSTWFFTNKEHDSSKDIQNLWELFMVALKYADESSEVQRELFVAAYNKVITQKKVKWNITMGLYWIRPYSYLSLDACNKSYIIKKQLMEGTKKEIDKKLKVMPNAQTYLQWIAECKEAATQMNIMSFPELSYEAWMSQISADINGLFVEGPKTPTNIQAIYALSICANANQLSKLAVLHNTSRYLQACLYTHAKTQTDLQWIQDEFERDVKQSIKGLGSNIQCSSYAIGIALRKDANSIL